MGYGKKGFIKSWYYRLYYFCISAGTPLSTNQNTLLIHFISACEELNYETNQVKLQYGYIIYNII